MRSGLWGVIALTAAACRFSAPPRHASDVPRGEPFHVEVAVTYHSIYEQGNAEGCVALPDTWTVDVDPTDAGWAIPIATGAVAGAGQLPAGQAWRCFGTQGATGDRLDLWITPDANGVFTLEWLVENTLDPLLSDRQWTTVEVRDPRADEDLDGVDGVAAGGTDCDDQDPDLYPGAPERCDGLDQDCDGVADDGAPDADADGTCDTYDFFAETRSAAPGTTPITTFDHVAPYSTVTFIVSARRAAVPTCLPGVRTAAGAPLCTDLVPAFHIRSKRATADGRAGWFGVNIPAHAPIGAQVYVQAFWTLNGVGDATNVATWTVVPP